jgi:hypothetical protein
VLHRTWQVWRNTTTGATEVRHQSFSPAENAQVQFTTLSGSIASFSASLAASNISGLAWTEYVSEGALTMTATAEFAGLTKTAVLAIPPGGGNNGNSHLDPNSSANTNSTTNPDQNNNVNNNGGNNSNNSTNSNPIPTPPEITFSLQGQGLMYSNAVASGGEAATIATNPYEYDLAWGWEQKDLMELLGWMEIGAGAPSPEGVIIYNMRRSRPANGGSEVEGEIEDEDPDEKGFRALLVGSPPPKKQRKIEDGDRVKRRIENNDPYTKTPAMEPETWTKLKRETVSSSVATHVSANSTRGGGVTSYPEMYPQGTFRTHVWLRANAPVETETKKTYLAIKVETPPGSPENNPEPVTTFLGKVVFTFAPNSWVSTSATYEGGHDLVVKVVDGSVQLTAHTPTGAGSVVVRLLPVELYSDLNNDGELTSADGCLVGKPYESGTSEAEKDKGTEFMFANDNLSNGAWDKEDTTTEGKPAGAGDDDAEAIFVEIGSLPDQTEVWLEHPASVDLKYYRDRKCTDEIPLSSDHPHVVGGSVNWPEDNIIFARAKIVMFSDALNPQFEGDLKLMVKQVGAASSVEAANMRLTIVKQIGSERINNAVYDYINENNTTHYFGIVKYDGRPVPYAAIVKRVTKLTGINARPHLAKGIDQVIGLPQWNNHTVIINVSYNHVPPGSSIEDNEGFYTSHRGELYAGGAWDTTCSEKASIIATPNPWKHISSSGEGAFNLGVGGDMPSGAVDGSGGLTEQTGSGLKWTGIADVEFGDANHLFYIGSTESEDTLGSFVADLTFASKNLEWIQCDGGASVAMAVANPNGDLKTVTRGDRHVGFPISLDPRHSWLKTYLGFTTNRPR